MSGDTHPEILVEQFGGFISEFSPPVYEWVDGAYVARVPQTLTDHPTQAVDGRGAMWLDTNSDGRRDLVIATVVEADLSNLAFAVYVVRPH